MDKAGEWLALLITYEKEQATNAARVTQLVGAINERKKEKHEKIARITLHDQYPVEATEKQFEEVRVLCKPGYEPVLADAISRTVINAKMFYENERKTPVSLLFEAMHQANISKKFSQEVRFASVVTLLKNGADSNAAGIYENKRKQRSYDFPRAELPLEFARYIPKLVKVLLQNGALPTGNAMLSMIFAYQGISNSGMKKLKKSIQHMLDHGADVTQSYVWGMRFISPMELARQSSVPDLIKLFDEHLKKPSTK